MVTELVMDGTRGDEEELVRDHAEEEARALKALYACSICRAAAVGAVGQVAKEASTLVLRKIDAIMVV